jgi:hypothetical protein
VFALLALAAEARPGHGFQSGSRDRLLAHFTHTECSPPDSSQCLLDRSQEMSIGLMQADLELRFSVGIGLVTEIAVPAARSWYKGLSSAPRGRQLVQLGE